MTGHLLQITLETCILEVGMGRNIFALDYDKFGFLATDSWIKQLWKFCHDHQIKIVDNHTPYPNIQRENDVYLTEIFEAEGFSINERKKINKCRMHLHAITISDIMNGFGNGFTTAYNCDREEQLRNNFVWPRTKKPNASCIKIWRKALRTSFGLQEGITTYQLGRWLNNHISQWTWFYCPNNNFLYQRFGNLWRCWSRITRAGVIGRTPTFKYQTNALSKPHSAHRATIIRKQHKVILTGWSASTQHTIPPVIQPNAQDNSDITVRRDMEGEIEQLVMSIQNKTAIAGCDGSYKAEENSCGASWWIEDEHSQAQLKGSNIPTGHDDIQSPYRSELFGILGLLTDLYQLCIDNDIQQGYIKVYCDCEGAVKALQKLGNTVPSNSAHFDALQSISTLMQNIPIEIEYEHIKGHLDEKIPYELLPRENQINTLVDTKAKSIALTYRNRTREIQEKNLPMTKCEVRMVLENGREMAIRSRLNDSLRNFITENQARSYWIKKKNLENKSTMVDWKLRQKSLSALESHEQRWLCKFTSGFCGTGKMLNLYKFQNHDHCPRCNAPKEHTTHVLRCQHQEAKQTWEEQISSLKQWMQSKAQIHPEMIKAITVSITNWREGISTTYQTHHTLLKRALRNQKDIGWNNFIEGFWAKEWTECQAAHYSNISSQRSAQLWISKTQRRIWKIAWYMWENRNKFLHETQHSIHPQEILLLDNEIQFELQKGPQDLPTIYKPLFEQTLDEHKSKQPRQKLHWLYNIWSVREQYNPAYFLLEGYQYPNNNARFKYVKWKETLI